MKEKTKIHWVIRFLLWGTALFTGCTETIDLSLKTNPRQMVVDGLLTNENTVQVVRLSWSVPYFSTTPSPAISGARVSITESDTVYYLRESTEHDGYYYIMPDVLLPAPGKTYKLTIDQLDLDGNGINEQYTATTTMPEVVKVDSTNLDYQYFNSDWEIWQVLAFFKDPPVRKNNYMFRISRNGNRVTNRPSDIRIANDKLFNGKYVDGLWVQSIDARADHRQLEAGDLITLEMAAIPDDFYNFMEAVKMNEMGNDPLFSGSPANIPGNISNGAIGIFTAVAISKAHVIYNPELHDR